MAAIDSFRSSLLVAMLLRKIHSLIACITPSSVRKAILPTLRTEQPVLVAFIACEPNSESR
jgi:hypothetical protein